MTSDEESAKEQPRAISKAVFRCLILMMAVLLGVGEVVAALAVRQTLGLRMDGIVGGLGALNVILATVAVDRILKRFGLSRSGKTLEVRERTVVAPEGDVADDEIVAVGMPKSLIRFLLWVSLPMCLLFGGALVWLPHLEKTTRVLGLAVIGFFGLGTLNIWWDRKPQAWADRDGITGYPLGFHLRRRFVPWSDVAACEIETFYDTFGKPVIIRPILKGWNGEALLTLNLQSTKVEDQERLVKYIKARLPKATDHGWE